MNQVRRQRGRTEVLGLDQSRARGPTQGCVDISSTRLVLRAAGMVSDPYHGSCICKSHETLFASHPYHILSLFSLLNI